MAPNGGTREIRLGVGARHGTVTGVDVSITALGLA